MKYQSFIFNPSFSILHFQSSKSTLYVLRQIGMTLPYPKIFKALALPPLGNPAGLHSGGSAALRTPPYSPLRISRGR